MAKLGLKTITLLFVTQLISWNTWSDDSKSADTKFTQQNEVGIVVAGGNTESQTYNIKNDSSYRWGKNTIKFTGHLLYGQASSALSARNWHIGVQYERSLSERFSLITGDKLEGDTFTGFNYRNSIDLGGKYYFNKDSDINYLFNETGYRFSYEDTIAGTQPSFIRSHIVRVYFEGGQQISQSTRGKLWVELLPDVSDGDNLQINFEPSLQMAVSEVFSLKLSFLGKFDNVPSVAGNKKFDYTYTTALVASL